MTQLINSVVKGFGMTLGRKAANRLTSNSQVSSPKNYLTIGEIVKTILWFFPQCLVSIFVVMIYDTFSGKISSENYVPNFNLILGLAMIFTFIIGYGYYNKKSN